MWLLLTTVVICLVWVWGKRYHGGPNIDTSNDHHEIFLAPTSADVDVVEDDLIAVITAAIHEFTGTADFEVVKIKPSAQIWTLTGRQKSVSNR